MSAALLPRGCTCVARLPSLARAFSSACASLSPTHRGPRPRPSPARAASTDEDWRPHDPPRGPQPLGTRLSPQKRFAQDRERQRLASANLDKPRWRGDQGERLARSAANVALDVGEIGAQLPQQRERSRRFRSRDGGGDETALPRGDRAALPRRGAAGGERMVPGRVNRSMQRNRDEVRVSAAPPPAPPKKPSKRPKQKVQALKKVVLPTTLRLDNLVNILKERLCASSLRLSSRGALNAGC